VSCGGSIVNYWSDMCWLCLGDGGWGERRMDEGQTWRTKLRRIGRTETFRIPGQHAPE